MRYFLLVYCASLFFQILVTLRQYLGKYIKIILVILSFFSDKLTELSLKNFMRLNCTHKSIFIPEMFKNNKDVCLFV